MSYLRRLALPALGWAVLGLAAVFVTRPSRAVLMLSGTVEWSRLATFAAVALLLGFGAAAVTDWNTQRRKR